MTTVIIDVALRIHCSCCWLKERQVNSISQDLLTKILVYIISKLSFLVKVIWKVEWWHVDFSAPNREVIHYAVTSVGLLASKWPAWRYWWMSEILSCLVTIKIIFRSFHCNWGWCWRMTLPLGRGHASPEMYMTLLKSAISWLSTTPVLVADEDVSPLMEFSVTSMSDWSTILKWIVSNGEGYELWEFFG